MDRDHAGGAALAGFHLQHRATQDLDLFTSERALEDAERLVEELASNMGLRCERVQTSPRFRRLLLEEGETPCSSIWSSKPQLGCYGRPGEPEAQK